MNWDDIYKSGDNWAICDRCGFKYRASRIRREPRTGYLVCPACYDPRHPLDSYRAKADRLLPKIVRPEPPAREVEPGDITEDDL